MRRPSIAVVLVALIALVLLACGGASGAGPTRTTAPAARTSPPATPAAAGGWTTFGGAASRAGVAPGAPGAPALTRRFARALDGEVYAQPLIAGGRIYVATENNSVYAFTSAGRQLWRRHLGAPVPGGDLPCGNIDPSGITGTPAISRGRLFVVAFLRAGHRHVLFGLRLGGGGVAVRARVDPPNQLVQQQRGALLAAHGRIYVPYGGLFGDCGPYRGYVISTTTGGGRRITYRNPATEAGIWAPGGISAQGNTLLVGTGNGGSGPFGYQNSVIRLSPALHRRGYWAPRDWRALSGGDVDEGSLAPLPVSGGRVLQIGKNGVGYLLRHGLGGVGGEQFSRRVCGGGAFGAAAFRAPLAVVPCGGSLYALRIGAASFSVAWSSSAGGVPIIAGSSVFTISGGSLTQLSLRDGHRIASERVGSGASSFPAPSAAGRLLVAPAGRGIVAFSL